MGAPQNWVDRTLFTGDNLAVMRGMNTGSVDLIYLDPPFNSKRDYAAPIGSQAAGAEFKDTWTLDDIDVSWINLIEDKHPHLYRVLMAASTNSDKSYLAYMAVRLLECHRLLADTGSIYLHCDPTMSHYLKLVMDSIWGRANFRNEIVWQMRSTSGFKSQRRGWIRDSDTILYYVQSSKFVFNKQVKPYSAEYISKMFKGVDSGGRKYRQRPNKRYYADEGGVAIGNVWDDITSFQTASRSSEMVGYPTQKPLKLLERIINASSNPGDVVFDPFCGCATTLVAAERLGRSWIGCDVSPLAAQLVNHRIHDTQGLFAQITHRTDNPQRTDLGHLQRYNHPNNRRHLYGQQAGNCAGCRQHFQTQHLEIDHIIARSNGGTDHPDNLQLLCGHCNRIKGNRGMEYLTTKLQLGR